MTQIQLNLEQKPKKQEEKDEKKRVLILCFLILALLSLIIYLIPYWNNATANKDYTWEEKMDFGFKIDLGRPLKKIKGKKIDKNLKIEDGKIVPVDPDDPDPEEPPEYELIEVSNDGDIWGSYVSLPLFSQVSANVVPKKIAPESHGKFNFVVRNTNRSIFQIMLKCIEENPNKANMKYRIKQDNKYVAGNANTWVYPSEIKIETVFDFMQVIDYEVEWKWVETNKDTPVGIATGVYKLFLEIFSQPLSSE
ncbi:hypothetical protein [Treponema sp. R6D11]